MRDINAEYDYNKNTKAIESVAKKKGFDLNTRGNWIYDLTPGERESLMNSKYSAQLNPNEFAEMASGVQQLVNTFQPGQPFNFNIPGLTQRELEEDRESWLSPLKTFAPLNIPGNAAANYLKNSSDWVEQPTLGMQRMGNVDIGDAMAFNPLNLSLITGAAELLPNIPGAVKSIPRLLDKGKDLLSNAYKLNPSSTGAIENVLPTVAETVAPKPWQMEELPGLHIKSTQTGSPLEKQLSKTGDINVNNITAHINKADVSQQDKFILDKVLKEKFPDQTKINYNDFRKAVSDELVILEKTFNDTYSSHGVAPLGFSGTKKSSFEMAINNTKADIDTFTKKIAEYENKIKTNAEAVGGTSNENMLAGYKERLKDAELQLAKNEAEYAKLPLENQTIVYSNKSEFGEGSAKHFPDTKEALGHARTLVTQEEPEIMHILESQSDWAQGDGASVLQRFKGEKSAQTFEQYDKAMQSVKSNYENSAKALEDLKYRFDNRMPDQYGNEIHQYAVDNLQHMVDSQKKLYEFKQANIKNWEQKMHFGKNHLERLLQENVVHAVEQGKTKMRYPTSETAVKIQGYEKKPFEWKRGEPVVLPNSKTGKMNNEVLWDDIINVTDENGKVIEVPANEFKELNPKFYNEDFSPKHKTILKKYDDGPKIIKKTLGQDVRIVTDSKGNTWYEFDIPKSFKEGKGEIKAFKQGGVVKSNRGQWDYPGQITEIDQSKKGSYIDMGPDPKTGKKINTPVLAVSDTGDVKLMMPGGKYKLSGTKVTEYPMAKNGLRQEQKGLVNLDQLTNFTNYNKPQPGGWLDKYN